MTGPRVKICGLRRLADARLAAELGAAALGCVMAPDSPRRASIDEARAIMGEYGQRLDVVLVFRDPLRDEVLRACERSGARNVQLHGAAESLCTELESRALVVWRVLGIDDDVIPSPRVTPTATRPLVLDHPRGGSGRHFDWSLLERAPRNGVFVAGGITPTNVAELAAHRPYGMDLSSGVESTPGVKDATLLRALFANLRAVES